MNTPQTAGLAEAGDAPIYAGLVEERGDVLAEVRRTAEQALREAGPALDFSLIAADAG
ncbi:hypothetical protein OG883_44780 [Streptomyces sp. NBC_01142]|uniref:hypothetical protein n=1 Tax=Streptomyces sp. NBC_01142 TaxID=2975865 RepID=UPI002256B0AB|nr:hypothetical protein [Streptomyces sp. NBC_01142]MCX4826762.1 hypothetical protein [Streptomyces sp. NBC_01142]